MHQVEPAVARLRMKHCPTMSTGERMQAVLQGFDTALVAAKERMRDSHQDVRMSASPLMMTVSKATPASPICKITFQRSQKELEVDLPGVGVVMRIDTGGLPMCANVRVEDEAKVAATLRDMQGGGGSIDLCKKIGALTRSCQPAVRFRERPTRRRSRVQRQVQGGAGPVCPQTGFQ